MKIIIVDMSAEEMRANKRIADSIIDGLTSAFEQICRTVDEEEEEQEDGER